MYHGYVRGAEGNIIGRCSGFCATAFFGEGASGFWQLSGHADAFNWKEGVKTYLDPTSMKIFGN